MTEKQTTIWLIIDHPWQLMLALGIKVCSPEQFSYNLLISNHKYWNATSVDPYRKYFRQIFFFNDLERAHSITGMLRFLLNGWKLKKKAIRLPVQPNDIFVTLSYFRYVENIITTLFSHNKQIFVCREDMYEVLSRSYKDIKDNPKFTITKSGWIHFLILEPLLRLKKRTIFYWVKGKERMHNVIFKKPLKKNYDEVFSVKSLFKNSLGQKESYFPYLALKNIKNGESNQKRVVFILSDYVKNKNYYNKIATILRSLKKLYGNKYLLELRLHPNNKAEYKLVDTTGWVINNEKGLAEEYLINHSHEIVLVASHISTALLFSSNIGLPSYSYHRCFGFEKAYENIFDKIFEGLPDEFFMKSLTDTPKNYKIPLSLERVKKSLDKLYASFK